MQLQADTLVNSTCRGLGALLVEKFASEGCNVAVNYNANQQRADEVAEKVRKEYQIKSLVVKGVGLELAPHLSGQGVLRDAIRTLAYLPTVSAS